MNRAILRRSVLIAAVAGHTFPLGAQVVPDAPAPAPAPSFRDVLSLRDVGSLIMSIVSSGTPAISPDGASIAYGTRTTDWEKNRYEYQLWLVRRGEEPFQLTRAKGGSATHPRWSPDGRWLAFLGDERQIYLINPGGGEARRLTSMDVPVTDLHWAPGNGDNRIAFSAPEPEPEEAKKRTELYGAVAVEDADYRMTHLWYVDVPRLGAEPPEPERLTEGDAYTVGNFSWSPDGTRIAFDHRRTPLITDQDNDISILDVASRDVQPLVVGLGRHTAPIWSPDGSSIVFGQLDKMGYGGPQQFLNSELAVVPSQGGEPTVLTSNFDENPGAVAWTSDGIFFLADQRTRSQLFRLNPRTRDISPLGDEPYVINSISFSADGRTVALAGDGPSTLPEIYRTSLEPFSPQVVTDETSQVSGWPMGTPEVIEWESRDGTRIEGTLYKPAGYDPSRRYPLLVNIHGGPMGVSRPEYVELILMGFLYPGIQWLAESAVILLPNYRGSSGYGEAFRSANVRHLGERDMWDVMSGVDYLIDEGIVHPDSLGLMGYSQGGYISAYLLTHTDRFKAVSVGGGVSSWVTYYVGTDIHQWARQYHQATPWEDPKIYAKTAPMTTIRDAKSPTLIQHGEFDRRVPLQSALELYRGLQDVGVETELVVFKGQGHLIFSPKEQLAAMWQNWQWFARHLWGKEVEIPLN